MKIDWRRCGLLVATTVGITGCANVGVQPWQRGNLARVEMAWTPDALRGGFRDHVLFSKEGSTGGVDAGGGGCGCN